MRRVILAFLISLSVSIIFIVTGYFVISFVEWNLIEADWRFIRMIFISIFFSVFVPLSMDDKKK